jgi:phenylalanyl-tRNA synthetase, alpha subunit (EC 6.1.1.20)
MSDDPLRLVADLDALREDAVGRAQAAVDSAALEALRIEWLGRKGILTERLKQLSGMEPALRRVVGERLNKLKLSVVDAIDQRAAALERDSLTRRIESERIDVTLPGRGRAAGGLHPVTQTIRRMERIFGLMGFESVEGPEIEDDWHNFQALNIPESHPARAMQDTFYLLGGQRLLRTHTSPVQIRTMQARKPPIRIICPGRVYRRDFDRTHSPMFHQIEGLYVAENVSLADLKHDLQRFLTLFFEREVEAMFRPSYFPFVEPGADVHIRWGERWLECLAAAWSTQRAQRGRHRPRALQRLRLRSRRRALRHAALRRRRPAPLLRQRSALPRAVRLTDHENQRTLAARMDRSSG